MSRRKNSSGQKRSRAGDAGDDFDADYEFREEANQDDINRLFDMGFVSLEEVEAFDSKAFLAAEQAARAEPGKKVNEATSAKSLSKRDEKAMQAGWTVSKRPRSTEVKSEKASERKSEKASEVKSEKESQGKMQKASEKKKPQQPKQPQQQPKQPLQQQLPTHVNENELKEWRSFNLHPLLLSALKDASFLTPQPIQSSALKCLLQDGSKHLMASAPTGSGKTLAFGLAILDSIYKAADLSEKASADAEKTASNPNDVADTNPNDTTTTTTSNTTNLAALILVPTRELAIQIEKHLKAAAKYAPSARRPIRLATVIGGMSPEKQERLLSSQPDLVIATPGRLAEAMEFDSHARSLICSCRHLVLDEADRMIQPGHFKELESILAQILATPHPLRRILLFSATLVPSKDQKSPFARLLTRLSLDRSQGTKEVAVVELAGRPASLLEWQCPSPSQLDKDGLVLYFLEDLRREQGHFGRVLMFVNAIETIRRLTPLFTLLGIPTLGLHAQMQQRQRLKNLDRFKSAPECLLIASDVAARGLDIQGIQHVIHYHLPKEKETYIHRCGRTARAAQSGSSLALFAPEERGAAERCGLLGGGVPRFDLDSSFLVQRVTPLVKLARRVESLQHTARACQSQTTWAEKAAAELGVDLDEDNDPSWKQRQKHQAQGLDEKRVKKEIEGAVRELNGMLQAMRREF